MKSSLLYKNCSNRALSFVKLCFNNQTSGCTVWICFQFTYLCCKQDHFKKSINSLSCMGRNRYKNCTSTPVFRNQLVFRKFLFYTFNIGTWFINLVNSNNDLNACCFCMADSLYCLRHYTIVRCNNQNCNICRISTTHTHCSKCFMSRSIQESNLLSVDLYHRSTDMLCDTASLTSGYICFTDSIQKRCLTMVNVTHNTDNRWSWNHLGFILFFLFQKFSDHIHLLFRFCNNIIFQSNFLSFFKIDLMVHSNHHTLHEKLLYDG